MRFRLTAGSGARSGECFRRDTIRGWRRGCALDAARIRSSLWHDLTSPVGFGLSVWLADRVVPWHKFNLVGFGAVNLQRAIRSIKVAVVRPRHSASIAAVSAFGPGPPVCPENVVTVPRQRCEMKNPTFAAELHQKLGAPSNETVESLRLLKAFIRLAPTHRSEVIELVERLAAEELSSTDHPLS